jgi:hypothetical protein
LQLPAPQTWQGAQPGLPLVQQMSWERHAVPQGLRPGMHVPLHWALFGTHPTPHFWELLLQVKPQLLPLQVDVPFGGLAHAMPHAPQFEMSVLTSTHLVPHLSGAVPLQVRTQVCAPPTFAQKGTAASHLWPQAPQFSGRLVSVSQISSGLAEQCA